MTAIDNRMADERLSLAVQRCQAAARALQERLRLGAEQARAPAS